MIEQPLLALTIILIMLTSILIYKVSTQNFDYWKKRKVPHPEPIPFFGNFADLMLFRLGLGFVSAKIYNQFPGEKYVGALYGKRPVLIVRDPDLIKLIMSKDFYYFNGRGFTKPDKKEVLTWHLFNLGGDQWRVLRQNLTPLFSSARMRNMFYLMAQCADEFEDFVRKRYAESDEFDARDTMSRFSMDVIGSCGFGVQMNSLSAEDTEFRQAARGFFSTSTAKSLKYLMRSFVPWLYHLLGLHVIDPSVGQFFVDLSRDMIRIRERKVPQRQDFIDLLTELKRSGYIEGDSIEGMKLGAERHIVRLEVDDNLLAAQSFVFFAAGFETSSTTMSYALYELAKNPDIQERVHTEIDSLLVKYDGKITYEMLQEAHYLEMVSSETLRKYPVLATITRECTSQYTLPDGVKVEKGVTIHLPVYALHHDPQYYPKPDIFDPERFSPEASRNRNQFTYLPFGEGHRLCIGMRFGKMLVMAGLISVLRNYGVEPCARTENIQFEPKAAVTTPKNTMLLKLILRKY